MTTNKHGRIIFLTGCTSSGKTSIALELFKLDSNFVHIEADLPFFFRKPVARNGNHHYYKSVPELAEDELLVGRDVILEEFLVDAQLLKYYKKPFRQASAVYLVDVHAPLEMCKLREQSRGDRVVGIVDAAHARSRDGIPFYDLEIDTSTLSPAAGALLVFEHIATHAPQALRQNLSALQATSLFLHHEL